MNVSLIMEDVNKAVIIPLVAIIAHVTIIIPSILIIIIVMVMVMVIYFLSMHLIDVDECSLGIDGCNQNCVNTNGSYLCYCNAGYHLMSDQNSCAGNVN